MCMCMCVCSAPVVILFNFCTLFFPGPELQLCFALICCIFFISNIFFWYGNVSFSSISVHFLNPYWFWSPFHLLLFFSAILSKIFSQVSNKHNIQLFFSTSVIWLLVSRSHFMSDFQATLILMLRTVYMCTIFFEAALVCPFNAVIKIQWKSLPIVQHDWTQHVHIHSLMRYEVMWIKYWKDIQCAV